MRDLLTAQEREERGEGPKVGDKARRGKARGCAHHVVLRDAHVEVPLGVVLGKLDRSVRAAQVRIQDDDALVGVSQFCKDFTGDEGRADREGSEVPRFLFAELYLGGHFDDSTP